MSKSTLFSDPQLLPCASLSWGSGDSAGAEAQLAAEQAHKFLSTNNLAQRFADVDTHAHFSVLELGFSNGINFLLSWQLWKRQRALGQGPARLVYTSVESAPVSHADLQRFYLDEDWQGGDLPELAEQLQAQYPLPIKGFHQLQFGEVTLNLVFGSVHEALAQIQGQADALYVNGNVLPPINEAREQSHLLQHLGRLSHDKSTFHVAANAQLTTEQLNAAMSQPHTSNPQGQPSQRSQAKLKQNYVEPWLRALPTLKHSAKVAVIGAGISGCTTALALQKRGYSVQLIEAKGQVAQGASGNKQGMLYAKLSDSVTVAGQLHQQGLQHSMRSLQQNIDNGLWQACGLLQLAQGEAELAQMHKLVARQFPEQWLVSTSKEQASQHAGQTIKQAGLLYKQAGWVSPPLWCQAVAKELELLPWLNTSLQQLSFRDQQWHLTLQGEHEQHNGQAVFDAVVLCNASEAKKWLPELDMPLKSIRGQVTYLKAENAPLTVVCGEGYVTPAKDGSMAVGASYNLRSDNAELDQQDHVDNLQRLRQVLPNHPVSADDISGGRVGFRAATSDYLPMLGQLADPQKVLLELAHLRKDKNYRFKQSMPWLPGLYINAGHGSKGLITAPLCAEVLAAQMAGEVLPVSGSVAAALEPNRFFLRDMMRRKR